MSRLVSLIFVTFLASACSGGAGEQTPGAGFEGQCAPGEQNPCPCPNGGFGIQVCAPDGSGFGSCLACSTGWMPDPGTGGGTAGVGGGTPGTGGVPATGGGPATGGSSGTGGVNSTGGNAGTGAVPGTGGAPGTGGVPGTGGAGVGGMGAAGGAGGAGGVGAFGGTGGAPPPPPPPDGEFAAEIRIQKVSIYQGVEIPLAIDGQPTASREAPVVQGRDALIRVFVEPQAGWQPREVTARLDLISTDPNVVPQGSTTMTVLGASADWDLNSTLNFVLPGDQLAGDLTYQVSIRETPANAGGSFGNVHPSVVFPEDQSHTDMGAQFAGPLQVTIVPFRYFGDGSGRLPDTSQTQMQAYFDILWALYPSSEVMLELRDVVDYNAFVGPTSGWSAWLDTLCNLRQTDGVDTKVYYYGIMAPASGWGAYGGGTAGLGMVPGPTWTRGRCSVGLGFPGADRRGLTAAHEVGHTLGRPHAPCGVSGGFFPYSGARLGSWGYDLVRGDLKAPDDHRDFMSYCDPAWISDYNYNQAFERIQFVNLNRRFQEGPAVVYRRVLVDVDGSEHWGQTVTSTRIPNGELREVTLYDDVGNAIGSVEGYWQPYGEEPAGEFLIPEPGEQVGFVQPAGMGAHMMMQR